MLGVLGGLMKTKRDFLVESTNASRLARGIPVVMKSTSAAGIKSIRAELESAKRKRSEWVEVFGDSPTRGLVLLTQRVERLMIAACASESRSAMREAFSASPGRKRAARMS
jgi:hypothetical protein